MSKPLPRYTDDIVVTVDGDFDHFAQAVVVTVYSKRYGCQCRSAVYRVELLAETMERALHELARAIGEQAVFGRPMP